MGSIKISNVFWKKIKKVQAISWNPVNIFYDCLSTLSSRYGVGQTLVKKVGRNLVNHELLGRKFEPVPTDVLAVDFNQSGGEQKCADLLAQHGVCLLPDFVDRDVAIAAGEEMKALLAEESFIDADGRVQPPGLEVQFDDRGDFQWQVDLSQYKTYDEIVAVGKPVINIRSQKPGEPDSGMADIFAVEQLLQKRDLPNLKQCYDATREEKMDRFLTELSGYRVRQANLYYNAGVVSTRGPHLDNNSEQYKIFIYLTDVLEEGNGPYCFVPGSHRDRGWMSKERMINSAKGLPSTEVGSFPRENATKMLAPAGTAIISCQSGIHFGWRQAESGRRIVLVGNHN